MKTFKSLIVGVYFSLCLLGCKGSRENTLMQQGNEFVGKIEQYKKDNNRLPVSLSDIGITVKSESEPPIYYEKRDSIHYTVSFGTTLGESKIYYSDSKKWEDRYREMK
jgi:type II secretory pathway pseudopilin PulG